MSCDSSIDLRAKLQADEACIGAWLTVPSPLVSEAIACCGFDWMAVDFEHSPMDDSQIAAAFVAAERHRCVPFVRLANDSPEAARRMLDFGAQGLIVPNVESADAFRRFARHCFYPPHGARGMALTRANLWGDAFDDYHDTFRPLLVAQIETAAGIEAAGDIAALAEVDALFLGPYDLSASLGTAGKFDTAPFLRAADIFKEAGRAAGKPIGIHQVVPEIAELRARIDEGYRFLAYGTDVIAMRHVFRNLTEL